MVRNRRICPLVGCRLGCAIGWYRKVHNGLGERIVSAAVPHGLRRRGALPIPKPEKYPRGLENRPLGETGQNSQADLGLRP